MRPSLPETPDVDLAPDDELTVEAPTAEQAIAQVHDRLGPDARILQAEKVLRGGLWGFFPRQVVQLTARPADPGPGDEVRRTPSVKERLAASTRPEAPRPEAPRTEAPRPEAPRTEPPRADAPRGLEDVLARLAAQEDDHEEGLGTALRRQLGVQIEEDGAATWTPPAVVGARRVTPVSGGEPPADVPVGIASALATLTAPEVPEDAAESMPTPAPAPAPQRAHEPAVGRDSLPLEDVEYGRGVGTPWSGRGLLMLGLPRSFVDAVLAQEPTDDAAWTYAVARALSPLCRPLPAGPAAIVGPRAERFSRSMGVPLVRLSGAPRGRSTFAVACTDSARARDWLAANRGARWTHLVVGGTDWRGLLFEGPLAVSWVGEAALGDAVGAAHELGMVLGPGLRDGGELVEPAPIELAMLLRDLLGGRA